MFELKDFPLMVSVAGKRLPELEKALFVLNDAVAKNAIFNVDYQAIKDVFGVFIEKLSRQYVSDAYLASDRTSDGFNDLYYSSMSLSTVDSWLKKVPKLNIGAQYEGPIMACLTEFKSIADAMKILKDKTIKGRKPNPNAKPVPAWQSAPIPRNDAIAIREKLTEITQSVRQKIVDSNVKWYTGQCSDIQVALSAWLAAGKNISAFARSLKDDPRQLWYRYQDQTGNAFSSDMKEQILRDSERDADDVLAKFVEKNVRKIAGISAQKGNLETIIVLDTGYRGTLEGRLRLVFADKSRFDVLSKVVWVSGFSGMWAKGQDFTRYPTTFHDVMMPDGSRMSQPSEERMNTVFAIQCSTTIP